MDIVRLPDGQSAPVESDCISIQPDGAGRFTLNGSLLLRRGDSEEVESVAMIGSDPYPTFEAAQTAGQAWAAEHGVEILYVTDQTYEAPE